MPVRLANASRWALQTLIVFGAEWAVREREWAMRIVGEQDDAGVRLPALSAVAQSALARPNAALTVAGVKRDAGSSGNSPGKVLEACQYLKNAGVFNESSRGSFEVAQPDVLLHLVGFAGACHVRGAMPRSRRYQLDTLVERTEKVVSDLGALYAIAPRCTIFEPSDRSSNILAHHFSISADARLPPRVEIRVIGNSDRSRRLLYANAYEANGVRATLREAAAPLSLDDVLHLRGMDCDLLLSEPLLQAALKKKGWEARFSAAHRIVFTRPTTWVVCATEAALTKDGAFGSVTENVNLVFSEFPEVPGFASALGHEGFRVDKAETAIAGAMRSAMSMHQDKRAIFVVRPSTALCAELSFERIFAVETLFLPAYYVTPAATAFADQAAIVSLAMHGGFAFRQFLAEPPKSPLVHGFDPADFDLAKLVEKRTRFANAANVTLGACKRWTTPSWSP